MSLVDMITVRDYACNKKARSSRLKRSRIGDKCTPIFFKLQLIFFMNFRKKYAYNKKSETYKRKFISNN